MRKRITLTFEQHRQLYNENGYTDEENFKEFEVVEDKLTSFGRKQHFFRKILKDSDGTFYKMKYSLGTNDSMTWEKCNSDFILDQVYEKTATAYENTTTTITYYE